MRGCAWCDGDGCEACSGESVIDPDWDAMPLRDCASDVAVPERVRSLRDTDQDAARRAAVDAGDGLLFGWHKAMRV